MKIHYFMIVAMNIANYWCVVYKVVWRIECGLCRHISEEHRLVRNVIRAYLTTPFGYVAHVDSIYQHARDLHADTIAIHIVVTIAVIISR